MAGLNESQKGAIEFLKDAQVIGAKQESDTQYEVIRTDALALSKNITKLLAGAGGISVVGSGLLAGFDEAGTAVSVVAIASAGVVLAATAIALAWVLNGDARARSLVEEAQVRARAGVIEEFRHLAAAPEAEAAASRGLIAPASRLYIRRKDDEKDTKRPVLAIKNVGDETSVLTVSRDAKLAWVPEGEIEKFLVEG